MSSYAARRGGGASSSRRENPLASTRPRLRTSRTFDPESIRGGGHHPGLYSHGEEDTSYSTTNSATTTPPTTTNPPTTNPPLGEETDPHWTQHFVRCDVPPDGDCLFSCVAQILHRMPPAHKAAVQAHMTAIGLTVPTVELLAQNPDMVRLLSVSSIRTDSPMVKNVIATWRVLYANAYREGDRDMLTEYRHMSCLHGVTDEELKPVHLSALLASMRQKSTYWGNEFDLRMLEEYLGVHFIVVSNEGKVQYLAMEHDPGFEPHLFCLLYRREWPGEMPHYQGLKLAKTGAMSFTKEELPRVVIDMCQRDLGAGKDTPWYISLAGL